MGIGWMGGGMSTLSQPLNDIIEDRRQEANYMQDDLIFVLSVNIMGLFLIDAFDRHVFAVECLWAIINTIITMYFYYKNRK